MQPRGIPPAPQRPWMPLAMVLLVLSPNFVLWFYNSSDAATTPAQLAFNLAVVLLTLAIAPRLWLGMALLTPLAILAPLEVSYIVEFGRASDSHLLGIVSESNAGEATDFLGGVAFRLGVLVLAAAAASWFVVTATKRSDLRWPARARTWTVVSAVIAFALFAARDIPMPTAEAADAGSMDENDLRLLTGPASITAQELAATYPAGVPIRLAAFMDQRRGLAQTEETLRDFRFNASHVGESPSRQVHVLVIGETGRPDRWQLNGYRRPTTPRLSRISDVVSFTDTVSAWAWTRMSVPVILTRKPPQDTRAFFPEKSLIAAFREAGFKTYWLSTQSPLGPHDSSIALHAREADHSRFLNPTDYRGAGVHDGALLGPLADILARDEPRQLIVLHTLGSHFSYADRYPAGFDVFQPSQTGKRTPSLHDRSQKEAMNNSYDNSIYYTDWLLSEIIGQLRGTDSRATLLYVADHGENLFDGACTKSGHGHSTELDFRVASIWWNSPQYAMVRPASIEFLRGRRDSALSTSHVFHTMLDAADIHYPGEDLTESVLSATWISRPRLVQGGHDFDEAVREPVCLSLKRAPRHS